MVVGEGRGRAFVTLCECIFRPGRTSAFVGINVAERVRGGVGRGTGDGGGLHSYSNKAGVTLFAEIAPPTPRRQRDKVRRCKKRSV